ncbi:uncharacterized protein Dwil_GK27647 [Drosophila willistoni]|uniref:C-type lectin domain-containing protein n=1 Tax=Drosophila willistoni TaxID=7260 RepID=A0A0Q9WT82_DROWI|nr:uncharacterized protein Dwil_GK27647 [Drosophila willistoni]
MQKRLESCETLKPPYAQERLDKIEMAMNKLQLSADKQIQSLLSWKSEVEAKHVNTDKESLVECQMEMRNKVLQVQDKSDALAICESKIEEFNFQRSHLASPQNEEELDGLSNLLKTSGNNYWLDVHNHVNQNEYISVTTGEKAKYLKWNNNEPNHGQKAPSAIHLAVWGLASLAFTPRSQLQFLPLPPLLMLLDLDEVIIEPGKGALSHH